MSARVNQTKPKFWDQVGNYLSDSVKIGDTKIPKLALLGLFGAIMIYVSVAGMISANAPWLVRGDGPKHIDYVWRLYKGDLPDRKDGVRYQPFIEIKGESTPQTAAKSPPLFHLIHVPVMGPLLDSGNWQAAIGLGRAVNVLLGVLCMVALSWAGWLFGGSRRLLHMVAVPGLAALIYRFTRLNVDFASDVLLVLFGTLSSIFTYRLLSRGPSHRYIILITLVTVAGLLVKAPFIVFMATNLLAVFLSLLFHGGTSSKQAIAKSIGVVLCLGVIILAATAWYYYLKNYRISGNWFNTTPLGFHHPDREVKSFITVITSPNLWELFYGNYLRVVAASILVTGFALSGIINEWFARGKKLLKDQPLLLTFLIMGLSTFGIFATQLQHAVGTGSINFRYILPALLPFGLFLSYGLLQIKHARGLIASSTIIAMAITSISSQAQNSVQGYFSNPVINRFVGGLYNSASLNGLPSYLVSVLILSFILGSLLLVYGLYTLSKQTDKV